VAKRQKDWALGRVNDWHSRIIGVLERALEEVKINHTSFNNHFENDEEGLGWRAQRALNATANRINNIMHNIPMEDLVDITADLYKNLDKEDFKYHG
jgi:hypothetical protein